MAESQNPVAASPDAETLEISIENRKSLPVNIFRIDPATFEQNLLQSLSPGGTLTQHCVIAETLVAKIDNQPVASFTACAQLREWHLYQDHTEKLSECVFTVENRRAESIEIFRVSRSDQQLTRLRDLNAGATAVIESFETERWVAQIGPRVVAAYQVTPRLSVWAVTDAENDFVPDLPIGGNNDLNVAAKTAETYQKAIGDVKAFMAFVEFPDVTHLADDTTAKTATHIIGDVKEWYRAESYGRLNFAVSSSSEWRTMPESAKEYAALRKDGEMHQAYISSALKLFAAEEINFADYNIAYIVAARTPDTLDYMEVLDNSPTLSAGIEVTTNNQSIWHAVTFGRDSYTRSWRVLLHETGHLFGLPDLYLFGTSDWLVPVGPWDIMCDLDNGQHFLGWHKYKLGWLDESQLFYLKSGEISLLLNAFENAQGVKMLVLPTDKPSKFFVVEIAQSLGDSREYRDKGILVYTVDAAVETGKQPVCVESGRNKKANDDDIARYGNLCALFIVPGTSERFDLGNGKGIEVINERQVGTAFQVRVRAVSPACVV